MSNASVSTVITDWDWAEDARPELQISENDRMSELHIGGKFVADIDGEDKEDLLKKMESYRDIFAEGAKLLRNGQHEDVDKAEPAGLISFATIADRIRIIALGCSVLNCQLGNEFAPRVESYLRECFGGEK